MEPHATLADHLDRRLRELVHTHEPLERHDRLDPLPRPLRERHRMNVRLGAGDETLLLQLLHDRALRFAGAHAHESRGRGLDGPAVFADHADLLEPVTSADFEVVRIVARGDLQGARSEIGLHVFVGDDRQLTADQWQEGGLPEQLPVTLIAGVNRHRGVREHGLGANRCDGHDAVAARERIVDVIERVGDRAILHLEVGDRGAAARVPVDHVAIAVDVALLV